MKQRTKAILYSLFMTVLFGGIACSVFMMGTIFHVIQ